MSFRQLGYYLVLSVDDSSPAVEWSYFEKFFPMNASFYFIAMNLDNVSVIFKLGLYNMPTTESIFNNYHAKSREISSDT